MKAITEQLAPIAARMRVHQSLVRPVSQVEVSLQGPVRPTFDVVRKLALDWIAARAGRPLPDGAWAGLDFELEDVGAQRTAAVALEEPPFWIARLDDSDRNVPQRSWVTEVAILETPQNDIRLGVRLHCVTRGEDVAFIPSIPRFVRDVVTSFPDSTFLEGRLITANPWVVDTEAEVDNLCRLLTNASRKLDVIVCALPDASEDVDQAAIDVSYLHKLTIGGAHVAVITGPASFYLSDRLGKEFSVFRSAVRTYLPAFDPLQDEPYRHPLALAERITNWPYGGVDAFGNLIVSNALRRSASTSDAQQRLPSFQEVRRIAAEGRRETARSENLPDIDLLKLAEQEIDELKSEMKRQRELDEGLVKTSEEERDKAIEERQAAESSVHSLRARIRSLESSTNAGGASAPQIPSLLDNFDHWALENLGGSVELHNRALKGVKKSQYEDPSFLYRCLLFLRDSYVPMRREGGLERKATCEAAMQALGLELSPTISVTRAGEEGDTYFVRYAGQKRLLDMHLKRGTSREERHCFRCYFFWDEDNDQVVVGWLPSHLETRIS